MKKSVVIILFALIWHGVLCAESLVVDIHQFSRQPALMNMAQGFQDSLIAQGIEAEYRMQLADGNQQTANQIARQMLQDKADLLVAVGRLSVQTMQQSIKDNAAFHVPFVAIYEGRSTPLIAGDSSPRIPAVTVTCPLPVEDMMITIRSLMPKVKKLGLLYSENLEEAQSAFEDIRTAAQEYSLTLVTRPVSRSSQVFQVSRSMAKEVDALLVLPDAGIYAALEAVLVAGNEQKIPVFSMDTGTVSQGVLAAVSCDAYGMGYKAGILAKKKLQGASEQLQQNETTQNTQMYINLASAGAMHLKIPADLYRRANMVYGKNSKERK